MSRATAPDAAASRHYALRVGLARAFGGAIFFSLPLLMTMEMWWLGFYMDRLRLALLIALMMPLLIALDHYIGFKRGPTTWREDVADGTIAYGVGIAASILVLLLLNVVNFAMPLREWIGKIALQSVPASFGAVLATSQLAGYDDGAAGDDDRPARAGVGGAGEQTRHYRAELLFMLAGAVFLAFNVAPTEEMVLIAYQMTWWHALGLALVSIGMMHAFVYAVEFRGAPRAPEGASAVGLFFRFTLVGYTVALLVSTYVLWTFGRFDAEPLTMHVLQAVVLGFPAGLGAAAARLIL